MKALRIVLIFVFSVMLTTSVVYADACSEGFPPCSDEDVLPDCCDKVKVPFDGGVSFLIAAGLGIGGYSIFKKKKTAE